MAEDTTPAQGATPGGDAEAEEPTAAAEQATDQPEAHAEEEKEEKIPYEILETIPLEGSVVQYKIAVQQEAYKARTEDLFKELSGSVTIEGFRRGKAPRKLLQIRFGKEIKEDAVKEIGANIADQLIEAEKLDVVGEPELKDSTTSEDKPVEIVLEFEIRPKIEITNYQGVEVEVEEPETTEAMVEERLQSIRERSGQYKTAPEGAVFKKGDAAVVDYEVLDHNGQQLKNLCRMDSFETDPAQRVPPELSEKIEGLKPGQTVEAQVESSHVDPPRRRAQDDRHAPADAEGNQSPRIA